MVPFFNPTPRGECRQEGRCLTPVTALCPWTLASPALPVPLPSLSRHLPSPCPAWGRHTALHERHIRVAVPPGPSRLCDLCFRWEFPAPSPGLSTHTPPRPSAPHAGLVAVKTGPWWGPCGNRTPYGHQVRMAASGGSVHRSSGPWFLPSLIAQELLVASWQGWEGDGAEKGAPCWLCVASPPGMGNS